MIITSIKGFISEAEKQVDTLTVKEVLIIKNNSNVHLVDLRDIRELWKEGAIPQAIHVPRGMLEFWITPDSDHHKVIFASAKKFISFAR